MSFSLLILLVHATARAHCREVLRPLNRSLSRREHAEKNPDLSTVQLSEEFRHTDSRCRFGCALTGNLNSMFSRWEGGLELHVFLH